MLTDYEITNLPFKGRGIDKMVSYIGNFIEIINRSATDKVRILEIGSGFGQVLIELANRFSNKVELFGVNSMDDEFNVEKALEIASYRGFRFNDNNIDKSKINVFYCDAGVKLPFSDDYFDLVISQVSIPYIHDKLNLITEVSRVLNPEGTAWLHVGFEQSKLCDSTEFEWSTLELYENDKRINLEDFFRRNQNFNYFKSKSGSVLKINRGIPITFDFELKTLIPLNEINKGCYGVKSVYKV